MAKVLADLSRLLCVLSQYLDAKYGSLRIDTEIGKKENRTMDNDAPTLSQFLSRCVVECNTYSLIALF